MKSEVLQYIQSHKNSDSDYWILANGYNDILRILLKYTSNSWQSLKDDLVNWDFEELEILAEALSYERWYYREDINRILPQRSDLFAHIFVNADIEIAFDLLDEIEIVFKGDIKPLQLLIAVKSKYEKIKSDPAVGSFYTNERLETIDRLLNEHISACS